MAATRLADEETRLTWKEGLAEPLRGRRTIIALGPLAGLTRRVELVRRYGAPPPLVLANGTGAGPVPDPGEAEVCDLALPTVTLMTEDLRRLDLLLRHDLPAHARAAIESYDPDGSAAWLVPPFVDNRPLVGRAVLAGRPRSWSRLEDKTRDGAVWEAVCVDRAPESTVPVDAESLAREHRRLDRGQGTVWSGDARDGLNGGGEFVRWVVSADDRARALEFFAPRCDRVRVTPFLEGVPCSVHGCVLPDGTATLRPLELGTLRTADRRFVYGGMGSAWEPLGEDVETMREAARRTGEHLRRLAGYRGFFGIDGVLTEDGFRPTELNPRFSGGVSAIASHLDYDAFDLLQIALVSGRDPGIAVGDLEGWVLPAMEEGRFAKALAVAPSVPGGQPEPRELPVTWDGHELRAAEAGTDGWTVEVGDSSTGVFLRVAPPTPPPGLRVAHLGAALLRFADAEVGTRFGPVEPAPDVRAGRAEVPRV